MLDRYRGVPSYPAIRWFRTAENLAWESRARERDFPPLHSLTAYFVLDPRRRLTAAELARLLAELNSRPEIDLAYRELNLSTPQAWAVDPSNDPLVAQQGYLNSAPEGIGANSALVWGSVDGAGVGFVDLENGWHLAHQDLPSPASGPKPILNVNDKDNEDHGTAVLGIVLGQPNRKGVVGIAPGANFLGVVSRVVNVQDDEWDVAAAIRAAGTVMQTGDVLLLEAQTGRGYPIEIDDLAFDAIHDAAGNGIIVIEAAGNGTPAGKGRNLDDPLPSLDEESNPRSLNRDDEAFVDSGAIMVSACHSNVGSKGTHQRMAYGGFGSRIDCYAWGEDVVTSGYGDMFGIDPKKKRYTSLFGGTSSAAAIIAGAAILLQQMARKQGRSPLSPTELRTLLADRLRGTPVERSNPVNTIGVMPDLEAIAGSL
ncbi:MAG: S8 family serine peptidase [Gemmatimonadales bacterium]